MVQQDGKEMCDDTKCKREAWEQKVAEREEMLSKIFDELYPNHRSDLMNDQLKLEYMVNPRMFQKDAPESREESRFMTLYSNESRHIPYGIICKSVRSKISRRVCDDFKKYGCEISNGEAEDLLFRKASENAREPFRYWVESLVWDKVPRLRRVFIDYLGASATDLRPIDKDLDKVSQEEAEYIGSVTEAWFMCIISRIYHKTPQMVVPVLTGADLGFIREVLERLVCTGGFEWICSCGFERTSFSAISLCKNIVAEVSRPSYLSEINLFEFSKSICDMEIPIKVFGENHPRRATLIVIDSERGKYHESWDGGVLFYPIECGIRGAKLTPYVREQIWAEAMCLYGEGHGIGVDSRVGRQSLHIQECEWFAIHPEIQDLDEWLDNNPEYSKKGSKISFQTVVEEYFGASSRGVSKKVTDIWKTWVHHTSKWRKVGGIVEVKGVKTSMAYVRSSDAGMPPSVLPECELPFESSSEDRGRGDTE